MFTHCVLFWLKADTSAHDRSEVELGLRSLLKIPGVVHGHVGVPASTRRPVVDHSYDFGLLVQFETLASHDAYQDHAIHEAFLERCAPHFARVQVYDFEDPSRR